MNKTTITARVTDQHLQLVNETLIASGGVDIVQIRFEFCGLWDGCGKTAVFYRDPKTVYHVAIVDNLVTVPWEVLTDEGHFYFGVFGSKSNVRPTEVIKIKVAKGAITTATAEPQEPTPTVYQQLVTAYGMAEARVSNLIAMHSTGGGLDNFVLEDDYFFIALTSNGVHCYADMGVDNLTLVGYGNYETDWYRVPLAFAPMMNVTLTGGDADLRVQLIIGDTDYDAGIRLVKVGIGNLSSESASYTTYYTAYYPPIGVVVPEVADVRVDHKGRIWGSAGDAVRGVTSELDSTFVIDEGTNLLNPDELMPGYEFDDAEMDWGDGYTVATTGYISAVPGDVFSYQRTLTTDGTRGIGLARYSFYDAEQAVTATGTADGVTITTPEGASFVRFCLADYATTEEWAIVRGAEVVPFEEYHDPIRILKPECLPDEFDGLVERVNSAGWVTPEKTSFFTVAKNLYDPTTVEVGKLLSLSNGTTSDNSNYTTTDYIPVEGGETYIASYNGSPYGSSFRYVWYDAGKKFIASASSVNPIELPADAAYIRFTYYYEFNQNVQFEKGAAPTEYVEPGVRTQVKPEYIPQDAELTARVKALEENSLTDVVNPEDTSFFVTSKNLFNQATVTEGKYVNQATGKLSSSASYICTDYIPVVAGLTYVASYGGKKHSGTSFRWACYDEDKVYISGAQGTNPMTMPSNTEYVRYSFYNSQAGDNQFELGSEPTSYEEGGTYLDPAYIRAGGEAFPLNLPPKLYARAGEELNVYFDNLVAGHDTDYTFDVTCAAGMQMERCYRITPTTSGEYAISIKATDRNGTSVEKTATIYVAAADARAGVTESILVLGDSTTANGIAISKLHDNFNGDAMNVTTLGTKGTSPNNHEGRSGWSFNHYFTKESTTTEGTNPFYNPETSTFDAAYYFAASGVAIPGWFFVNLGINDVFGPTNDGALTQQMAAVLANYDTTIASVKAAAPNTKIGVVLTIPPNYSQDAFGKAYGCEQTRDRYKRNNVLWVQELIARYGGREEEGIYLVPIHTNLDTKYNMGMEDIKVNKRNDLTCSSPIEKGGVHPVSSGYWQIADVYWFFLKNQA